MEKSANKGLSRTVSARLAEHLSVIRETKDDLVEQYFPRPGSDRTEFKQLLERYVQRLDQLLQDGGGIDADGGFPFVAIGCSVSLEDLPGGESFTLRVVAPDQVGEDADSISYLSPVGKALLLKTAGEEAVVAAPGGTFRYRIVRIELEEDTA